MNIDYEKAFYTDEDVRLEKRNSWWWGFWMGSPIWMFCGFIASITAMIAISGYLTD